MSAFNAPAPAVVAMADGRAHTDEVVRAAGAIAHAEERPLHLLHAMDIIGQPLSEAVTTLAALKRTIETMDDSLRNQLLRTGCSDSALRMIAHHDWVRAALQHAREHRLGLLVGAPEVLIDSVASAALSPGLAELLRCPVLVMKQHLEYRTGRILVAQSTARLDSAGIATLVDSIAAVHDAATRVGNPEAPQLELVFTALDPVACTSDDVRASVAAWAAALREGGFDEPRWAVGWSERPGHYLRRRIACGEFDLVVLHRGEIDSLAHCEVIDSVFATVIEVAAAPLLIYPTRLRGPLREPRGGILTQQPLPEPMYSGGSVAP